MMSVKYPCLRLAPGREFPLLAGHPWVFGGGVLSSEGCRAGDVVEVLSTAGDFLGLGTFHPANTIRVRMLSRERQTIDADFFSRRFGRLYAEKTRRLPPATDGLRLCHGDADFLPGLVVDLYDKTAVFQIHTKGMETHREAITMALSNPSGPIAADCVVERSDVEARRQEGLPRRQPEVHHGNVPELIPFRENGLLMYADVLQGQKTGFFLDQRDARSRLLTLAKGRNLVNLFSYTSSHALAAMAGGAAGAINVDTSRHALDVSQKMIAENGLACDASRVRFEAADVFKYIEAEKDALRAFLKGGILVCDPPAFAKSASALEQAKKAYGGLNRQCFELLEPGAIFITSSCSGVLSAEDFAGLLRLAAGRAGKRARILETLSQPFDHTRLLAFPEGPYLKTCIMEIDDY